MIKLVKNELIKIFKRKSIYLLLIISFIVIIVYNYMNPDQNPSALNFNTNNLNVSSLESSIKSKQNDFQNSNFNIQDFISQNVSLEFAKLYNSFEKDSWQRYALNEERMGYTFGNNSNYNQDITNNINIIKDYELNINTKINDEQYNTAINKYNGYINVLNLGDWKEYVKYKINSLNEEKDSAPEEEKKWYEIEIKINQLRLNNNIEYKNDRLNTYIQEYREKKYYLQSNEDLVEKDDYRKKQIQETIGKINLLEYAIENRILQDISTEKYNIIVENKIDARISFIRALENFNLIIVIIVIYISCMIVTEETNKGTIKSLLTKPHKRSTILISKMLACFITVLISITFICISQYIIGGLFYGFDSYKLGYIGYDLNTNNLFKMSVIQFMLIEVLVKMPIYIIISLFCIFMGTANNNTSMSMILTLIIFLLSSTILAEWSKVESLAMVSKYFITNNWDFSTYLFGNSSEIPGVNLEFSIIIYIVYFTVLIASSIKIFNKKEINHK